MNERERDLNEAEDIIPALTLDRREEGTERRQAGERRQNLEDRRKGADPNYTGPERRSSEDRRENSFDRRTGWDRRRGPGVRRTDDRRSAEEGEMNDDQFEFIMAIDQYKRANARPFPTFTEILEIAHALGYRKVAEPRPIQPPKKENDGF